VSSAPVQRVVLLACLALLWGCDSERSGGASGSIPLRTVEQPPRVPGSAIIAGRSDRGVTLQNPYWRDAAGIADGGRLYDWYNCSGCHAQGGGGMGPPLMDDQWIYGSRPVNIFDSIYEGRPGGMPAFGSSIPTEQIWKIAAFVQSLGDAHGQSQIPAAAGEASTPRQRGAQR
jgi:cytochrome c oxidase cbb3-type subunit 3